jgi:hypothetical protein
MLTGHHLVRVQQQNGEHDLFFERAERDRSAFVEHLERAENPELHQSVLPLSKPQGKPPRLCHEVGPYRVLAVFLPRQRKLACDATPTSAIASTQRRLPRRGLD